MPIYEYLCEKCEHEFEREQRITDPPVKTCPKCRSRKVTKLISRTSFVLKGGGWYNDLYSSAKKDAKGGTDSSGGADSSTSTSDSKSDSTPKSADAKTDSSSKSEKSESKGKTPDKAPDKAKGKPKGKSAA